MVAVTNKEKVDYLESHGWFEEWNGSRYVYINPDIDRYEEYNLDDAFELQVERDK